METASKKTITKKYSKGIISEKVKDYSHDPFVIKKGKTSEAFLNKHGFPKELLDKR